MVYSCPHKSDGNDTGGTSDEKKTGFGDRGFVGGFKKQMQPTLGTDVHLWPKTLDDLLFRYPCCPPDAFYSIPEFFQNSHLNVLDDNCKKIRIALRNWCSTLRMWLVDDFNTYYSNPSVTPYFNSYGKRFPKNMYYGVDQSVHIANELLLLQFQDDEELIVKFLTDLYNIVDRKIAKFNSMCICSPPSAGKNYFFDAVASYFLNYGMFGTANKTNNFSWSDGAGKRLVLWNEPNYEQFHVEKIKELLGGDVTRIHVKYKNDQPLTAPPVIILTNNMLNICKDPVFADRLVTYEWRAAPFLKLHQRKLNPLFFYKLLKRWNIIEEKL